MAIQKTTMNIDKEILAKFDFMAEVIELPRSRVIADALKEYIEAHYEQAKLIHQKQEELKRLKEEL